MSKELVSLVVVFPILIALWGSWLCTNQINFKSCPVQCGSSVLRSTNGQYGGDMPELRPVVKLQEIIQRIKESGTVPTPSMSSTASLSQAAEDVEPEDWSDPDSLILLCCWRR